MFQLLIIPIGRVAPKILETIGEGLKRVFPKITCQISARHYPLPKDAYNSLRRQYHSTYVLNEILDRARHLNVDKVLGVTDNDLYVPHLNFVFGEAQCPGRVALISLYRLRPEFYRAQPNSKLFEERVLKEAVHELGHTLTLNHCDNPTCVMFFSNSITDTDFKQAAFCDRCLQKLKLQHPLK